MAVTSVAHGSQSATIDSEHTLDTQASAGVYVLVADLSAMEAPDIVVLRIKTKAVHDGSSHLAYMAVFAHAQSEPHKYSVPVPIDTEIICTLEQTDGTGAVAITAFADHGGDDTTVTSAGHNLSDGDSVTIAGTTNYNGTFTVSGVSGSTYRINKAFVANDATGTGTKVITFPWSLLKM